MAGLLSGQKNSSQTPNYTKIQLQTSALGLCIPIGWGKFRAGPNLIDYVDFTKKKVKQAKGKGGLLTGGKGSGQYTYTATIFLALCEGPVQGIGLVYINQDAKTFAESGFTLFTGTNPQTPASYLTSYHPDHALTYAQTAYVGAAFYDLGSGASLPQHNFEVRGRLHGTSASPAPHNDANMADIIDDFLTEPQYSIGLPSSALHAGSLAQYRTYCEARGLWFSPYLSTQEQVTTILQRWAQLTNSWIFWSGDKLKFVPLGDCQIAANGVVYQPDCQAIYDLTYDDFILDGSNAPVTVTRSDPSDGYNRVRLHIKDRLAKYNSSPVEWTDQTSVDRYGVLQAQEVQADEICSLDVGATVAMLLGLRATYVRNTFKFSLGYGFVLLEPGDIVTVTEPNIGLDRVYVRIAEIEEDENGLLAVTAEEFPYDCSTGSGTSGNFDAYTPPGSLYTPSDAGTADPGNVNTPLIYEPPVQVTHNGQPSLWIGASGGANWGGANVYVSFDGGTNYSGIGTISTPSAQGVLTATLASHADPDSADTLSVDLAESEGTLQSTASHADADAFRTLCVVADELIAYGTVTAGTSANAFDLTYLRRGVYGATVASHAIGAEFTRVDLSALLEYPLQQRYVGQTLYFKFASFNLLGGQTQDLSAVSAYTYTPTGWQFGTVAGSQNAGNLLSSAPSPPTGLAAAALPAAAALSWTASTDGSILSYGVWRASGTGASFGSASQIATLAAPATSYTDTSAAGGTGYTYFLSATNAYGTSSASSGANVTTLTGSGAASYAGGLTAIGSTQAGAYALTATVSVFTTVASGTGARLPSSPTGGDTYRIVSRGANDLAVYPATGGAIEGFGTNAAALVAPGGSATFIAESSTTWLAT